MEPRPETLWLHSMARPHLSVHAAMIMAPSEMSASSRPKQCKERGVYISNYDQLEPQQEKHVPVSGKVEERSFIRSWGKGVAARRR